MEVHAHTHTPRKKWTHYLWEFLMLFLAVFCGFLAENEREHYIEHQREEQYINSMIEDLQTDTANLSTVINGFRQIESRFDTVIRGFEEGVTAFSRPWAQSFLLSFKGGYPDFYHTDRTIQQLKNSGGMRLIKSESAANGIIKYDADVKDLNYEENFLSRSQQLYIDEVLNVWSVHKMYTSAGVTSWNNNKNLSVTNNFWITKDPVAFEHLFNKLAELYDGFIRHGKEFEQLKVKAAGLINLLKKEYHLQ